MRSDLEVYARLLEKLFAHYHNKYSTYRIETAGKQWMTVKGFTRMLSDFEICPKLLPVKEALHLFKGLLKEQEEAAEAALNYHQTLELIGRMAMQAAKSLQRLAL